MNRPRIIVLGAVAVDVKAKSFGAIVAKSDVPGRVHVRIGGVARNVAKDLALLGADVSLVSAIGGDEFGRMVRADLARAGVNLDHLIVSRNDPTAAWVGILDEHGDLEVGIFGGEVLDALTPQFVGECAAALGAADLIAFDATLPRPAIDAIVAWAKASRIPLYLNPASVARARTVADVVGDCTIVSANALEAQVLTGVSISSVEDAKRAAQTLVARGVNHALVTLGAEGMVYADGRETRYAPAQPAGVVDTTGAGDALAAAFLLCHLRGCPLEETLSRALRAAALTVACAESASEEIGKPDGG